MTTHNILWDPLLKTPYMCFPGFPGTVKASHSFSNWYLPQNKYTMDTLQPNHIGRWHWQNGHSISVNCLTAVIKSTQAVNGGAHCWKSRRKAILCHRWPCSFSTTTTPVCWHREAPQCRMQNKVEEGGTKAGKLENWVMFGGFGGRRGCWVLSPFLDQIQKEQVFSKTDTCAECRGSHFGITASVVGKETIGLGCFCVCYFVFLSKPFSLLKSAVHVANIKQCSKEQN